MIEMLEPSAEAEKFLQPRCSGGSASWRPAASCRSMGARNILAADAHEISIQMKRRHDCRRYTRRTSSITSTARRQALVRDGGAAARRRALERRDLLESPKSNSQE
jgi:hypothetical protein